ncbi:argininosuccinate lyase [Planctomycetales bacterium ZRK34]|nr:argininosuccinate lyase [Planctomycetales bacterium ZRK34]
MSQTRKPWEHAKSGGSESDALAERFVESISYDTRMYKHDIAGSIAHARMLCHVELINADELAAIEKGLGEIEAEITEQGQNWPGWKVELEDVHMCIEAALIEKIGDPGRKLHTGRSRNDQVATDLHLWIRDAISELQSDQVWTLIHEFYKLAERNGDTVIPSYTHLQRAQPIVVGGECMAWIEAFDRCWQRLIASDTRNRSTPLGSGAIAGSSLPLDRDHTAEALRTGSASPSSMYSTANRDLALDFVYTLSTISMWLSRWAEQWIIYMTVEFGMLTIGDAYTTGSSMMPQKRNPDMLELIRGRCGNVYGHLMALLTICKGITIGYNRDLQEDKRHVFAAYDTVKDCLQMAAGIVRSAKFKSPDMSRGYMDATALAEYLVTKGVPFRTAHQYVGALVHHCIDNSITQLSDLTVEQMNTIAETTVIEADVMEWLGAENVVKRYQTYGNAGLSGYRQQLEAWKKRLSEEQEGDTPAGLFGDAPQYDITDSVLVTAYEQADRTLDDLPYTDEFESIYKAAAGGRSRTDLFHRLHNLRKAGKLPRLGKAREKPPIITGDQTTVLTELVEAAIGKLSLRDQLPFTDDFDHIVAEFNARTGLQFSPYQVWRVIAKLAK